jgi:hypothetical protein
VSDDPREIRKSFHLAPAGTRDTPLPRAVPWLILLAFIAFCLLVLWIKGR